MFSISSSDLGALLTNAGFVLNSVGVEGAKLNWYQEQAKELAKGTASIDLPWKAYFFDEPRNIANEENISGGVERCG